MLKYNVRIFDTNGKAIGAGKTVIFKVNGKTKSLKTDSSGYATYSVKLGVGKYTITANYGSFSISNKITVKPVLTTKNMKVKKILSLDEIIYCISLLEKLSADSKTIDKFLMLTNKERRKQNPIYVYIELYDKLINSNNKEILNLVNTINYELSKMFICSNEQYKEIKDNILESIKYLLNIVDFEYEKSKAKIIKYK